MTAKEPAGVPHADTTRTDAPRTGIAGLPEILGWLSILIWFALTLVIKIDLYRHGVSVGDIHLHANALVNTAWPDRLLYTATYHAERGIVTLLQDHFQPTSLLLIPIYKLFDTPLVLVALQALGPVALVWALVAINRYLSGPRWLGVLVAVITLYNPAYLKAVIDGAGGYRHDAQFLIYLPLFLAAFIHRRWGWAALTLALFCGLKQNAPLYGVMFGGLVAILGLPFGDYRRAGAAVAIACAGYFVLVGLFIPGWIGSPNQYVSWGASTLAANPIVTAWNGFWHQKWYLLNLYFLYGLASPPLYLANALDVGIYALTDRSSAIYYNFNSVTFLGVATLVGLWWLRRWPERSLSAFAPRAVRWVIILALCHATAAVAVGLGEFRHVWAKNRQATAVVDAASMEAAWNAVDRNCGVAPQDPLLVRFHRLPYWIRSQAPAHAHLLITIDPATITPEAVRRDDIGPFIEAHRDTIHPVERIGPLTIWRNDAVPCRGWEG